MKSSNEKNKKTFWIKDEKNFMKDYQEADNAFQHLKVGNRDFSSRLGMDSYEQSRAIASTLNKIKNSKISHSLQNTRRNIEFKILKLKIN